MTTVGVAFPYTLRCTPRGVAPRRVVYAPSSHLVFA
jgi:hypothetical protein